MQIKHNTLQSIHSKGTSVLICKAQSYPVPGIRSWGSLRFRRPMPIALRPGRQCPAGHRGYHRARDQSVRGSYQHQPSLGHNVLYRYQSAKTTQAPGNSDQRKELSHVKMIERHKTKNT